MSNNLVAKHDFNVGGAHKSGKDYTRLTTKQLLEMADEFDGFISPSNEENWGVDQDWITPPKPKKGLNNTRDC
ncbi:hypothetical protein P13BB106kb_p068 [Pectobacterium phage DU_PP_V]|uniref:Uncharacterized protein n=1 Tax=Pectobacterium phage DU_PP_V TaxID=2041492 RepID=A0A2D2W6X9_9CAUD|nr:hypothetical protein HOS40_gp101 [Pectobacterium phage DU_PP_V]ATS94052.1 hypothetical protein P13BB106kb_p068 [Pectobacterium phage DU_PP_V]